MNADLMSASDGTSSPARHRARAAAAPSHPEVAERLNEAGLATLLFDLLTEQEERDRRNVFDIRLLADRLVTATRWAGGPRPP